ncbi:MAG TPA: hypothetical protein VFK08_01850 [Rhodanobacteraceae bacterium]|nr:hypothetical protein [Rhodanobacteraceae bacterium]
MSAKAGETNLTPLVVGITSHRNIPAREIESIRARVRDLFACLRRQFPHSPLVVVSALAEGGDQLVAEEGLACGARLVAPLPLPRDLYERDFTDDATRAAFDALCAQAHVIRLPLLPGHTLEGVAQPGVERNRQYAQAGAFVARHCHLLLAIWDGKGSDRLGGTAQVVQYYLGGVMPGHIERRRGARSYQLGAGDERLVCHLVCSRNEPDGAPHAPLQPGEIIWRTGSEASAPGAPMPDAFHAMFAHADEFNEDAADYREQIEGAAADERSSSLDALFRAADWLAMHFQKRVLLAMRVTYTVAALMGIAFAVYDNLSAQNYMIYVFLLLFAAGIVISTIARKREWHRKYLDYRALAEGLRVQDYWRRAGISLTADPEFAHDSLLQKQDIELGWTRNVMRSAGLMDESPRGGELDAVIREWVGENADAGQLGYYRRKTAQRERTHRITEGIGALSLYAGIGISIALAVLAYRLSADLKNDLIVIMAVFSVGSAVREAYAYRKADKELIKQYRFMQRIFGKARAALDDTGNPDEQREILRSLGEAALAEHAEWAVMHRQRPLEPGRM